MLMKDNPLSFTALDEGTRSPIYKQGKKQCSLQMEHPTLFAGLSRIERRNCRGVRTNHSSWHCKARHVKPGNGECLGVPIVVSEGRVTRVIPGDSAISWGYPRAGWHSWHGWHGNILMITRVARCQGDAHPKPGGGWCWSTFLVAWLTKLQFSIKIWLHFPLISPVQRERLVTRRRGMSGWSLATETVMLAFWRHPCRCESAGFGALRLDLA